MHISYNCVSNVLSCFQTSGSVFLATSLSKFQTTVTGGTNPVHHTIMLILLIIGLLSELWQHLFQFHVKFHTLMLFLLLKRHEHIHSNFVYLNSIEFFPCGKADLHSTLYCFINEAQGKSQKTNVFLQEHLSQYWFTNNDIHIYCSFVTLQNPESTTIKYSLTCILRHHSTDRERQHWELHCQREALQT